MLLYIEHCKNGNIHEIKKMNEQYNHNLKYFMGENKFVDGFKCARENGHTDIVSYLANIYQDHYILDDRNYQCDWDRNAHNHLTYVQYSNIMGFLTACSRGNYDMVRYFVEAYKTDERCIPIDIHIAQEYGFVLACGDCQSGNYDIVKYLVELYKNDTNYKEIDIHANNEDGFIKACQSGNYDIVKYLVELYKNDDKYGPINIHAGNEYGTKLACFNGYYNIVQYLIELHENNPEYTPIDINNSNDRSGYGNCIGHASKNNQYIIIQYLINKFNK